MNDLKYISLLLTVSVLIGLFSCTKEDHGLYSSSVYWGEVSALKDGETWEAKIFGNAESVPTKIGFEVLVDYFNEQKLRRGNIYMFRIPRSIGKHQAVKSYPQNPLTNSGATFKTLLSDGDVIDIFYHLVDSLDNHIEVTRIDGDEVWGTFQLTFIDQDVELNGRTPTEEDYVRFTEGYFHTRLQ